MGHFLLIANIQSACQAEAVSLKAEGVSFKAEIKQLRHAARPWNRFPSGPRTGPPTAEEIWLWSLQAITRVWRTMDQGQVR
jgi:hypothetical protein